MSLFSSGSLATFSFPYLLSSLSSLPALPFTSYLSKIDKVLPNPFFLIYSSSVIRKTIWSLYSSILLASCPHSVIDTWVGV